MPAPIIEEDLGDNYKRFTLQGKNLEVKILNFGGTIQHIFHKNTAGQVHDLALGFDNHRQYPSHWFGAIVGRLANRVANAEFTLDGKRYQLAKNLPPHYVHGGNRGFDQYFWENKTEGSKLILEIVSPDGDEGFPGEVKAKCTYEVTDDDEIVVDFRAVTTAPTVINLANHSFFNLEGEGKGNIFSHVVEIPSSLHTPFDELFIPTGNIEDVDGTNFDYREPTRLTEQFLRRDGRRGYDTNYIVEGEVGARNLAVRVTGGGRTLEVFTTQPGLQFYTGNYVDCEEGKSGRYYGTFSGLCLFTQHHPDSPNKPQFPSTVLRPGEEYHETSWFKIA